MQQPQSQPEEGAPVPEYPDEVMWLLAAAEHGLLGKNKLGIPATFWHSLEGDCTDEQNDWLRRLYNESVIHVDSGQKVILTQRSWQSLHNWYARRQENGDD